MLLATAGPVAAQTADELNQAGLDHFNKGFYEAAPRGESAKAAEEYRLAEQSFQAAIRSNPDWVEPYLHLGRTYFVQEQYRQAAELYQKALTLAPQRKEIYIAVGLSTGEGRGLSGRRQGAANPAYPGDGRALHSQAG